MSKTWYENLWILVSYFNNSHPAQVQFSPGQKTSPDSITKPSCSFYKNHLSWFIGCFSLISGNYRLLFLNGFQDSVCFNTFFVLTLLLDYVLIPCFRNSLYSFLFPVHLHRLSLALLARYLDNRKWSKRRKQLGRKRFGWASTQGKMIQVLHTHIYSI